MSTTTEQEGKVRFPQGLGTEGRVYAGSEVAEIIGLGMQQITYLANKMGVGRKRFGRWEFTLDDIFKLQSRPVKRPGSGRRPYKHLKNKKAGRGKTS